MTEPRDAYLSDKNFTYSQLWSFVEQIYHIRSFNHNNTMEVGIGSGFVSIFLKTFGYRVKTLDINPNLKPDIVAPVHSMDDSILPGEFDLISCCEVLEHIGFENFESAIRMFSTLSQSLFLTLPVHGRKYGLGGVVILPRLYRWFGIWLRFPRKAELIKEHRWEIDYDHNTRKKEILKILNKYYSKVYTGYFMANPYHRYFKCTGAKAGIKR
jgi:hypothetical protein